MAFFYIILTFGKKILSQNDCSYNAKATEIIQTLKYNQICIIMTPKNEMWQKYWRSFNAKK